MDRIEIESKLGRDRAWLLETYAALRSDQLTAAVTPSEHDAAVSWSALDHLAHLAGIERNFNRMIRRHFGGDADPVGLLTSSDGAARTRDEIMAMVHKMNEDYVVTARGRSLTEIVAMGQEARAETLSLLASLSDEQLGQKLPGAPWADGTVGGVIATNADHGRMHWKWIKGSIRGVQSAAPAS